MRLLTRILLIALAAVALTLAACGDDDDDGLGDGSASPAANGSATPSATGADESPGASPDETDGANVTPTPVHTPAGPTPVAPTLDTGVRQIGEGTINFTLVPNSQVPIDGLGLVPAGAETPPCAAFVFAFNWSITDPYPVGGNQVAWRITRQDSTEDVAAGADGKAKVGCGRLTVINTGPDQVTVAVHYLLGAIP